MDDLGVSHGISILGNLQTPLETIGLALDHTGSIHFGDVALFEDFLESLSKLLLESDCQNYSLLAFAVPLRTDLNRKLIGFNGFNRS